MERADVERLIADLVRAGHVVTLRDGVAYPRSRMTRIEESVSDLIRERESVGLAELRDALGLTRRYAQAILEHMDSAGITIRHGERRVLRQPGPR